MIVIIMVTRLVYGYPDARVPDDERVPGRPGTR